MRHFLIKFNHGVEIGAYHAYVGHFKRTGEAGIHTIIQDEWKHQQDLRALLEYFGETPNKGIDLAFSIIGRSVGFSCKFFPLWSLDFVARTMEMFAIFNYVQLAKRYPQFRAHFQEMANTEDEHKQYFKGEPTWLRNQRSKNQ